MLSLIGGVGGSITMLSYNYWMREEGMRGAGFLCYVRGDVAIAYIFTALFGISIMLIANDAFFVHGVTLRDAEAVPKMAAALGALLGTLRPAVAFSVGFWAAVFASLLGVWQSVPYLYADFYGIVKKMRPPSAPGDRQGHEHAVSPGARLHHARADSVRLHRPPHRDHRHLHDRRQPVRAVPRGDAALLEQPRHVDRAGAEQRLVITNLLLVAILLCSSSLARRKSLGPCGKSRQEIPSRQEAPSRQGDLSRTVERARYRKVSRPFCV